jgi:uncharacterized integral membrane protein
MIPSHVHRGENMSMRTLLLVAVILLIAGFVALNFEAIVQPTTLNLAFSEIQAPLGLVMLGMIVVLLVVFLLALVYFQTSHLMEVRRITREASEQRQLADRAEASRFTELRELLHTEMQAVATRDGELSNQLMQKMAATVICSSVRITVPIRTPMSRAHQCELSPLQCESI